MGLGKRLAKAINAFIDGIPGEIGKLNTDGSYTAKVDGTLNDVYVRLYGDPQRTITAIDLQTSRKPRLTVRVRKNVSGRYVVIGVDTSTADESLGEAAASNNIPPIIADYVNAIWNSDQFKPGRVRPLNGQDLQIQVEELPYPEILLGGPDTITDLATAVAAIGSGKKAWVVISVNPTDNTITATNGADEDPTTELTWANACAIVVPTGDIPLAAYMLADGVTTLPIRPIEQDQYFYVDLRPWLTLPTSGGSGMTDFTLAGDSGTPQTIADANTLAVLGGVGLSSVASATDTVTMNLDNTGVTPGSYTNTAVTFDAQGRATAASSGAAPAPVGATYIVQTADATLTNEQAMGALATGIVKNTTTTGVQSIATAGTDYLSPTGTENFSNKTSTNKLMVDGSADEIQLLVQGNATQTALLAVFENSAGADQITIAGNGAMVVNESGNDADFRVEGSGQANQLFVDASTNRVGINTGSPARSLDVVGDVRIQGGGGGATADLHFLADSGTYILRGAAGLTGSRTINLPQLSASDSDTIAMLAFAQSLSNKTLITPTIASFTNAQHDHSNAAGGGALPAASIPAMTGATFSGAGASGAAIQPAAADNTKVLSGAATYVRAQLTLFSQGADVTVASSAAETTLIGTGLGSPTLPANLLNEIGRAFEIRVVGYGSRTTGNTTMKIKVGGTTIFTFGAAASAWGTNARFEIYVKFTTKSTGATGTIKGQGYFDIFSAATTVVRNSLVATAATTLDLTGTLAVDVTWQWSVNGAAQTVTCTNLDIIQIAA